MEKGPEVQPDKRPFPPKAELQFHPSYRHTRCLVKKVPNMARINNPPDDVLQEILFFISADTYIDERSDYYREVNWHHNVAIRKVSLYPLTLTNRRLNV